MNIKLHVVNGKVKYLARVKVPRVGVEVVGSDTRDDTAQWMIQQDTPRKSDEFDGFPIAVKVGGTEYFFEGIIEDDPKPAPRAQKKRRTRGE